VADKINSDPIYPLIEDAAMKRYCITAFDDTNEQLFSVIVEAPNQAVARMMVLALMYRNFATAPLADRIATIVSGTLHAD